MPPIRKFIFAGLLLLATAGLVGCLTCERKEYVFQLTGPDSGKLTIRYINIFSSLIDSSGEVEGDYEELMKFWLNGEKIEHDFPQAKKIRKRLYKEGGMLCGEVTMEFDQLSKVRLFRYNRQGPLMFSMSAVNDDGEIFLQTNGEYGGDKMPVIFWPEDARTLRFSTKIAPPDSTCVSLLDIWGERY